MPLEAPTPRSGPRACPQDRPPMQSIILAFRHARLDRDISADGVPCLAQSPVIAPLAEGPGGGRAFEDQPRPSHAIVELHVGARRPMPLICKGTKHCCICFEQRGNWRLCGPATVGFVLPKRPDRLHVILITLMGRRSPRPPCRISSRWALHPHRNIERYLGWDTRGKMHNDCVERSGVPLFLK